MRISGNTILITGGTSGIGRGLAVALHAHGNLVIVTGRRREQLDAVTAAHPGIAALLVDVDDPQSVIALASAVAERYPDLNVLIANAGISEQENLVAGWDDALAERLVQTNIISVLRTVGAFLPVLKAQVAATLIVTGSKLAFVPLSTFPTYCATKAFLHSWLQSLRHQLRHGCVEVLELLPPYVATKLTGAQQLHDPRAMPLEAFVAEVMALLETGDHPHGEILIDRALHDRAAEREGRYDAAFAMNNPA